MIAMHLPVYIASQASDLSTTKAMMLRDIYLYNHTSSQHPQHSQQMTSLCGALRSSINSPFLLFSFLTFCIRALPAQQEFHSSSPLHMVYYGIVDLYIRI